MLANAGLAEAQPRRNVFALMAQRLLGAAGFEGAWAWLRRDRGVDSAGAEDRGIMGLDGTLWRPSTFSHWAEEERRRARKFCWPRDPKRENRRSRLELAPGASTGTVRSPEPWQEVTPRWPIYLLAQSRGDSWGSALSGTGTSISFCWSANGIRLKFQRDMPALTPGSSRVTFTMITQRAWVDLPGQMTRRVARRPEIFGPCRAQRAAVGQDDTGIGLAVDEAVRREIAKDRRSRCR